MIAPARVAAYEVLCAVNGGRAVLPHALANARQALTDERDRALAGEIATGTLRWQGAFDHLIAQFGRRPLTKFDPEVLNILRLTMFQLLHLDRVPAAAAVNDAVNLVRRAGKTSAAPLVNGVLRRVSRERHKLAFPPRPSPEGGWHLPGKGASHLEYLETTLSHPKWLAERWLRRYGFEAAEAWALFDNTPAPLTLRANTLRASRDEVAPMLAAHGVDTEPTRFAPDGLVVRSGNPLLTPLAADGLFVVQDEASQLVAVFADARPGTRVLDLCASPGGKTTAMAAAMGDHGFVVGCDVRPRRVHLLARGVRSSGATCIRIVRADAAAPPPFRTRFDLVLLDAPCSGLGTLRRDPDIRWRRGEGELAPLAAAQDRMLEHAGSVVPAGGRLVYSTCSSEPEENEVVVAGFLGRHPEFRPARHDELPSAVHPFLDESGWMRTLPFRDRLEAFFAAMLVRIKDLR